MPDPIKLTEHYWTFVDIEKVKDKYKVLFTGMIDGDFGERLIKIRKIEKMEFDTRDAALNKLAEIKEIKEYNNAN